MTSRVLLIEDEAGIGEPLKYQLDLEGFRTEWVRDGAQGLATFQTNEPDLIVLDLMLPGLAGEEICRRIRRSSEVPIIILTAKDAEVDKVVGLELGADDYVTKPFSTRELIARIKAVLRRSSTRLPANAERVLEGGGVTLDPTALEVTVRGKQIHLPRKEFELLEVLMQNSGRVVARESLVDEVWGPGSYGNMRTLDVHIKRLRTKIETDPQNPRHIVTARGWGYKFVP